MIRTMQANHHLSTPKSSLGKRKVPSVSPKSPPSLSHGILLDMFRKATAYSELANRPIDLVGLNTEFENFISVYTPVVKYHWEHTQAMAGMEYKETKPAAPIFQQLSISTTWRYIKVADAEMLHSIQDSLQETVKSTLQQLVPELLYEERLQGLSTPAGCQYAVEFSSDDLVNRIVTNLLDSPVYHRQDSTIVRELILLYLRFSDCFEATSQANDIAINFIFRAKPDSESIEAKVEKKLDFLVLGGFWRQIRAGDNLEITPLYRHGCKWQPIESFVRYELAPPIPWLYWNGAAFVGTVPPDISLAPLVEVKVKATSSELAGHISLERIVRASVVLEIVAPQPRHPPGSPKPRGGVTRTGRNKHNSLSWRGLHRNTSFDFSSKLTANPFRSVRMRSRLACPAEFWNAGTPPISTTTTPVIKATPSPPPPLPVSPSNKSDTAEGAAATAPPSTPASSSKKAPVPPLELPPPAILDDWNLFWYGAGGLPNAEQDSDELTYGMASDEVDDFSMSSAEDDARSYSSERSGAASRAVECDCRRMGYRGREFEGMDEEGSVVW